MDFNILSSRILPLLLLFLVGKADATVLAPSSNLMTETANLFSLVIENAKPAVVYIQVKRKPQTSSEFSEDSISNDPVLKDFFGDKIKQRQTKQFGESNTEYGFGSGFLFNPEGYILTNSHVIANAVKITITMADKTTHTAKIIGTDKQTDIGLLKIRGNIFPSIPLGDSDREKPGSWVLAIGSPYRFIQTVTAGIISATGRNTVGISDYENFIQTDAAINPGNSGGPLINIHGEAIGINTAFLTQTGGYTGIGFAIPINMARSVTEQLLKKGKVTRAWLGVSLQDADLDQLIEQGVPVGQQAAIVVKVKKNSPAEQARLQKGDVITAINNIAIGGAADLRNRIALSAPKSPITLEYYRNASKLLTTVILGTL